MHPAGHILDDMVTLRSKLHAAGLSIKDFSSACGLSQGFVHRVLSGKHPRLPLETVMLLIKHSRRSLKVSDFVSTKEKATPDQAA